MDEQKRRLLTFHYQLDMQYLWAIHELEIANHEWMRQEKINAIISRVKIIAGAIIVSAIYFAGICSLLIII